MEGRELATVLAALRLFQRDVERWGIVFVASGFDHFAGGVVPLSHAEIDKLCERLNAPPRVGAQLPVFVNVEDVEAIGFDAAGIDANQLASLADTMADGYLERGYWEGLRVACEGEGLEEKPEESEEGGEV